MNISEKKVRCLYFIFIQTCIFALEVVPLSIRQRMSMLLQKSCKLRKISLPPSSSLMDEDEAIQSPIS